MYCEPHRLIHENHSCIQNTSYKKIEKPKNERRQTKREGWGKKDINSIWKHGTFLADYEKKLNITSCAIHREMMLRIVVSTIFPGKLCKWKTWIVPFRSPFSSFICRHVLLSSLEMKCELPIRLQENSRYTHAFPLRRNCKTYMTYKLYQDHSTICSINFLFLMLNFLGIHMIWKAITRVGH